MEGWREGKRRGSAGSAYRLGVREGGGDASALPSSSLDRGDGCGRNKSGEKRGVKMQTPTTGSSGRGLGVGGGGGGRKMEKGARGDG